MSKRFSTLDTTRLLFEHPKILFRMIERMDRNEARFIRESDLVAEVMDYTRSLGKADDAKTFGLIDEVVAKRPPAESDDEADDKKK